jgi:hypothetical protein
MNKLVKGLIPAGQPCPFFNRCNYAQTNCPNDKLLKESPFSCKQARRFDALEEASQIGETSVKGKVFDKKIDWDKAGSVIKNQKEVSKALYSLPAKIALDFTSHLTCCINFAGNENDHVFRMLVGHHPRCPKLKGLFTTDNLADRVKAIFARSDNIISSLNQLIARNNHRFINLEKTSKEFSDILSETFQVLTGSRPDISQYLNLVDLASIAKKKMKKIRKLKRKLKKC